MKRLLFILVSMMLFLVACGGDKDTSTKSNDEANQAKEAEILNEVGEMPIVKEPIELKFMAGRHATNATDYNEVTVWKEYSKLSGININWELIPRDGIEEKRNLALAGGSLPDVFYTSYLSNNDLNNYGEQGTFIKLNDLIDENMPNLKELFKKYPEIEKGMTFPDGSIYALPAIYDPDFPSLLMGPKPWIREDWLEALDMEMPETTDQFYDYLKAVKETDLNGNGKADEIPFAAQEMGRLIGWLKGSFGLGNRGAKHNYIDIEPGTDDLRFFPISDGYKDLLEYVHKLYDEGLVQENIYTIEVDQSHALGTEGLYGSTVLASTETIYGEVGKNYTGIPTLEGPNGDRMYSYLGSPLAYMGGFVVTNVNKYPAATLRWMDYFYGDEGATLYFMGIEGETYEKTADGFEYVEEIKNNPSGSTEERELAKHVTWMGGGYPGIVKQEIFNGSESLPLTIEAAEKNEPYFVEEVWPEFTYTVEESKRMQTISTDIEKYVDEMQDKFITGAESFDKWDDYVAEIKKMNLEEYLEINTNAYERYKKH